MNTEEAIKAVQADTHTWVTICASRSEAIHRWNAFEPMREALRDLLRDEKLDDDAPALIATRNKCHRLLASLEGSAT